MRKKEIDLTTDRPRTAHLVQPGARRRILFCSVGGKTWFQFSDWRLPRRLNWLWRWLARRTR